MVTRCVSLKPNKGYGNWCYVGGMPDGSRASQSAALKPKYLTQEFE